jgi:uncharacterized protein (DUF2461 family)
MEKSTIASNSLFLKHLEKNNNREWFAENDLYFGTKQYYYFCGPINTTYE